MLLLLLLKTFIEIKGTGKVERKKTSCGWPSYRPRAFAAVLSRVTRNSWSQCPKEKKNHALLAATSRTTYATRTGLQWFHLSSSNCCFFTYFTASSHLCAHTTGWRACARRQTSAGRREQPFRTHFPRRKKKNVCKASERTGNTR